VNDHSTTPSEQLARIVCLFDYPVLTLKGAGKMEFPHDPVASARSLFERRQSGGWDDRCAGSVKGEDDPFGSTSVKEEPVDEIACAELLPPEERDLHAPEESTRFHAGPSSTSSMHSDPQPTSPTRAQAKVFTRRKAGQSSTGRQPGQDPLVIEFNDLVPFFKVSQRQACTELGIGLSTIKRLCRKFGIKRWPGSLHSAADTFSWCTCTCKHLGGPTSSSHQDDCPHAAIKAGDGGFPSSHDSNDAIPSVPLRGEQSGSGEEKEAGGCQDLFVTLEGDGVRESPLEQKEGVFATSQQGAHSGWLSSIDDEWLTGNLNEPSP